MKKIIPLSMILILSMFSCSRQVRDDSITDYSTTGFITDSCFQVVLIVKPDPSARSLTERRDSAMRIAREQIATEVRNRLRDYFASAGVPEMELAGPDVEKRIEIYLSRGYKVCEYYLEDAEAVIVYRICDTDLKREIDGFAGSLRRTPST